MSGRIMRPRSVISVALLLAVGTLGAQEENLSAVAPRNHSGTDDMISVAPAGTDEVAQQPPKTQSSTLPSRMKIAPSPGDPLTLDLGNDVQIELNWVGEGEFDMGSSNADAYASQKPVHRVKIRKGFLMGRFEITKKQYKRFLKDSGYDETGNADRLYLREIQKHNDYSPKKDNHPVDYVSWKNAKKFCEWASKNIGMEVRLPSEAEWEYAARGGSLSKGYIYSGSDTVDDVAWYLENIGSEPDPGQQHPVGKKRANELGLYDMSGNVWEWCEDGWHDDYSSAPVDGSAWAGDESARVLRGGARTEMERRCRPVARHWAGPTITFPSFGFRVVVIPR